MAKKVQEKKSVSSKLMTGKDELAQRIKERIVEGQELLDYPVKVLANKIDSFGNSYGEYDKTEQSNFLLAYDKWKRFNMELLRRSFDDPNNEYIQEYEDSVRSSVWSDWVSESKYDIRRQITVFESLIERLPLITSAVETNKVDGAT